jgi:Zn-dependent protease
MAFRALKNIPVKFNISFLFLLLGIPLLTLVQTGFMAALQAGGIICLAFSLVILHEYGHAWAAIRCGLHVESISLWVLGGLAKIRGIESLSAREEIFISICGPLVNFLLAAIGIIPLLIFKANFFIVYFVSINLVLGLFNLVPAFPMDGGRILRGILYLISGDRIQATITTAKTGMGLGFILGLISFSAGFFLVGLIFIFVVYVCYSILETRNYSV